MPHFELLVRDEFAAAHQLRLLDGTLEPLHGHNWTVELELRGDALDGMGVVADFTVIRARLREVLSHFHDRFLNELPEMAGLNPSAENVALRLHQLLADSTPRGARLTRVRVWEASGCAAVYAAD